MGKTSPDPQPNDAGVALPLRLAQHPPSRQDLFVDPHSRGVVVGASVYGSIPVNVSKGQEPMSDPKPVGVTLLVLYSLQLEECRRFYQGLGLDFVVEKHGQGPEHYAAVLPNGMVFELYPTRPGRQTDALRLGLIVDSSTATPPLTLGQHILTDPEGRTVEVHST